MKLNIDGVVVFGSDALTVTIPDGYVLVPVDEASNIIAMRKALEEIIEWTDRYTSPDHPITIFAKKALSAVKEKDNE